MQIYGDSWKKVYTSIACRIVKHNKIKLLMQIYCSFCIKYFLEKNTAARISVVNVQINFLQYQ